MRFAYPWMLLLIPALGAAAWAAMTWGERRRPRLPHPAAENVARHARPSPAVWAPHLLRFSVLALLAVGLARPQKVTSRAQTAGQGLDIMLVVDSSPSMAAVDIAPSRIEAAKDTARRFILGRVHDRIGLVTFGGTSQLASPLTLDYDSLLEQLAGLQPGMTMTDGTAVGDGIVSGVSHLAAGDAKSKVLILLTDGRSNAGVVDPLTAAKAAAAQGVKVYTIGTAGRGRAWISYVDPRHGPVQGQVEDDLDDELLDRVAAMTDGRYFRATSLTQLKEVYATIDKLEKSKVELPPIVSADDLFRPFALLAAALLLLETGLTNLLWLRWP